MNHTIKQPLFRVLIALFGLIIASNIHAMAGDKTAPIELEADAADINEAKNISIYTGNVVLVQGSMKLKSDKLTVYHKGRKPGKFVAIGKPVHFSQNTPDGPVKGHARKVEYYKDSDEIELTGNAYVKQVDGSIKSDRITWDRTKGIVKGGKAAKGKSRVKIVIPGS